MSSQFPSVTRLGSPPSALITKTAAFSPGRESNAIQPPSGDQWGVPVTGPPNDVSCTGFEPSLLHTQISKLPERSDMKAIRFPSGENCSSVCTRGDEISSVGGPPGVSERGPGARQILSFS